MWIDATVAGGMLYDKKQSQVADKVGFAAMPIGSFKGAPTWLWSWNLGIPATSKQQGCGADVRHLGDVERIHPARRQGEWLGRRCRPARAQSTYDNPEYQKVAPFAGFVRKAIERRQSERRRRAQPRPYTGAQFVAIPEFQGIGTQVGQTIAGDADRPDHGRSGAQDGAGGHRAYDAQAGYPKK